MRNQITAIKNAVGEWIYEESEIKDHIRNGFSGIYSTYLINASKSAPTISQWHPRLSEAENMNISGGPSDEEIKSAL